MTVQVKTDWDSTQTATWTEAQVADNWSPFQRMAVEFFEDCRIETLLCREYPGLRRIFLALHPKPTEDACDPETTSCLRHRMAMLSRALLDPNHGYQDATLRDYVVRFHALLADVSLHPSAAHHRRLQQRVGIQRGGIGTRIAQMVIARYERVTVTEATELGETARAAGGFGHTGTR